ncbi:carbonic anhydrase [Halalkalibacter wakoensis JCM 9140]|uniref:Carbonic anhydrase n=1 Tax=Halalkalibacter wakoensis JCM 9140 TaxID=1236970 RepID=W4Q189_9BACI|nr:hypothetical protein [Halalkalibacter wakoensis]GAE25458.1 carbonic anhydrase [Halalkalibacter wakoensis JCM 9140]
MVNDRREGKSPVLIVTDVTYEFQQKLGTILGETGVFILSSQGAAITQPYGCLIRNIILAIYQQGVEHIYLIAPKDQITVDIDETTLLHRFKKDGIDPSLIDTLDYVRVTNKGVMSWLGEGKGGVEHTLLESKELLEKHPLIPERVQISAYTLNTTNSTLSPVSRLDLKEDIG